VEEKQSRTSEFDDLDDGLDARTPSPALRRASRAQGRALLRAGRKMWRVPDIGREPHHPLALGVVADAAGLTPREAAVAAAYGSLTGPATAAVRLLGLDPYGAHALLAALAPECDRIAHDAADHARDPVDELPAAGAPLLDLGAEHHATWEVRLFAS
jgi:urease accessory protein